MIERRTRDVAFGLAVLLCLALCGPTLAADWPMWRYDANRSAASPQQLPAELHLQWVREYPALETAWEDPVNRDRMPFDRVYEPVVSGTTIFIGSNRDDKLVALDTRTGQQRWAVFADGPVRLPPVVCNGKVYFASDDGYLYCVSAEDGSPVWKFRGGPADRRILGNGRLSSIWPARGGPVVEDGTVYFAASVWPFMGTFIHALDAETGEVVWTNDGSGSIFIPHPHSEADSFGGVGPQGALAVVGDRLLVPGGRSVPACLDRQTGKLLYYHLAGSRYHRLKESPDRKLEGGSHVSGIGKFFLNHRGLNTGLYDLETGDMYHLFEGTTYPVLTEEFCYLSGQPVVAYSLKDLQQKTVEIQVAGSGSSRPKTVRKLRWQLRKQWECPVDGTGALIKAGKRLYAGGRHVVSALELTTGGPPKVVWTAKIDGTAGRIIAADDRLFVVTLQGTIYAFGADEREPIEYPHTPTPLRLTDQWAPFVEGLVKTTSLDKGYCLVFGLRTGEMAAALATYSPLRVIAVDPDAEKVAALRRRFDEAGLYGTRISLHVGDATTFAAPPYLAVLTVFEDLEAAGFDKGDPFLEKVVHSLRPYGGIAWLPMSDQRSKMAVIDFAKRMATAGTELSRSGRYYLLRRRGPLPGSADWTHQYGNIANTVKSDDKLVKAPLGLLWFGGNTHDDILPRHGHGPPQQVIGGRLFIQGVNRLSARDVYTGQVLWRRTFDDLGTFGVYYDQTYDPNPLDTTYNQIHLVGANARGTNYVAADDGLYLAVGGDCLVLDPATGETITTLSLPAEPGAEEKTTWGYIGVYKDLLIAGRDFVRFTKQVELKPDSGASSSQKKRFYACNYDVISSRQLVVMDRHSGKVHWTRDSEYAFRHNAIAVGAGKLFCIDALPAKVAEALKRKGATPNVRPRLMALDVGTGETLWSTTENVFGSWLSYSEEHDLLLQSGRRARDMLVDEPDRRMAVHQGANGSVVWDKQLSHGGPCILHGDTILLSDPGKGGSARSLLSGEPELRKHPLTGEQIPWTYQRNYGCGAALASEHLLTFRSGAAGYYDLATDGGTGNLGGFKSGCTDNLIAANGVLNAPDYTRTCSCPYQNQTSLALIHMPDVPTWTFNPLGSLKGKTIRRLGLNFAAPGDRRSENGTLWLDHPSVGGDSPEVPVTLEPNRKVVQKGKQVAVFAGETFRHHPSAVEQGDLRWVAASGLLGVTRISVALAADRQDRRPCTVRLVFCEPDPRARPGDRVFDVAVQGKTVLSQFDVVAEGGGPRRAVIREFRGVSVADRLTIGLTPKAGTPLICGVEVLP